MAQVSHNLTISAPQHVCMVFYKTIDVTTGWLPTGHSCFCGLHGRCRRPPSMQASLGPGSVCGEAFASIYAHCSVPYSMITQGH